MKCSSCGSDVEKGWEYCPRCGFRTGSRMVRFNFGDIFSRMRKEMNQMSREMDSGFERDIEAFDLSPFFRKPINMKGSGFSIKITSGTGANPKVEVKTFGGVDQQKIQQQLEQQLGYRPAVRKAVPLGPPKPVAEKRKLPIPKITEEPKTEVKSVGSAVVVDMELPGVRSEDEIEITELESSVEVKAVTGDRGYFKILTKPEQFRIVHKKFEKGKLHLEFG